MGRALFDLILLFYKGECTCAMCLYHCHAYNQEIIPWLDTSFKVVQWSLEGRLQTQHAQADPLTLSPIILSNLPYPLY